MALIDILSQLQPTLTSAAKQVSDAIAAIPTDDSTYVSHGGDLQYAINNASPGTTLKLPRGATFGAVTIPPKEGGLTLTVEGGLPNGRITDDGGLPALGSIKFLPGTENVLVRGIRIDLPNYDSVGVRAGDPTTTFLPQQPDRIVFDKVVIKGGPGGAYRGFEVHTKSFTLLDSLVLNIWQRQGWKEGQAVCGWNGPGPFYIFNSFLEASGENVMFGGADCRIAGMQPAGLVMRGCDLFKPDLWRDRTKYLVKNIFELKLMSGAIVEDNRFSGCWASAQAGDAVLFTPRNQNGTRPDAIVKHILFNNNVIERVDGFGITVQGYDNEKPTHTQAHDLRISGNVINAKSGIGITRGWNRIEILGNTLLGVTGRAIGFSGPITPETTSKGLVVQRNIFDGGNYGISGDNTAVGTPTLDAYAPGYVFNTNAIETTTARKVPYPTGNLLLLPGTLAGLVNPDGTHTTSELIGYGKLA